MDGDSNIVTFDPRWRADFARLNYAWINALFAVEEPDRRILENPEHEIIEPGGQVFIALCHDRAVGTVALKREDERTFELTKMAVDESVRGRGIGKQLLASALSYAQHHGATRVVLSSHSKLTAAIAMYRAAGFIDRSDMRTSCYSRCNIYMIRELSN